VRAAGAAALKRRGSGSTLATGTHRMDVSLPRLRDEVVIRPFEGRDPAAKFIAAVDGRHFLLSEPVAVLLELTRQHASVAAVASGMSRRFGRTFVAADLQAALRTHVPPLLVGAGANDALATPLLASRRLLSAAVLDPVLRLAQPLFSPGIAAALCASCVALDGAVVLEIWRGGLADAVQVSVSQALLLVLAGVFLHEIGHLAACRRYGAAHGGLGCGLYWFLPVFYAEVHGAWLLTRRQRSVVDIAGVYFQCVFLGILAAAWLLRPSGTLWVTLWLSHFLILNTLNPVLKYDGYWLLSDLSGRHNLHAFIRESARGVMRRLTGHRGAPLPPAADRWLVAAFLCLAGLYFAYLIHFMGHNLAYAATALQSARSGWQLIVAGSGLLLISIAAIGISGLLARAVASVLAPCR
jgi:putative peptide zinc metalloprotease protein